MSDTMAHRVARRFMATSSEEAKRLLYNRLVRSVFEIMKVPEGKITEDASNNLKFGVFDEAFDLGREIGFDDGMAQAQDAFSGAI